MTMQLRSGHLTLLRTKIQPLNCPQSDLRCWAVLLWALPHIFNLIGFNLLWLKVLQWGFFVAIILGEMEKSFAFFFYFFFFLFFYTTLCFFPTAHFPCNAAHVMF